MSVPMLHMTLRAGANSQDVGRFQNFQRITEDEVTKTAQKQSELKEQDTVLWAFCLRTLSSDLLLSIQNTAAFLADPARPWMDNGQQNRGSQE